MNRKSKRCKNRGLNNDDLSVSESQVRQIMDAVDEIVAMQEDGSGKQKGELPFKGL